MERYKTSQVIEAFEIKKIEDVDGVHRIIGEDDEVTVDNKWVNKHKPEVKGYFVRSMDGYEYYLSAVVFFRRGFLIDPTARKV